MIQFRKILPSVGIAGAVGIAVLSLGTLVSAAAGDISTFAGDGNNASSGDGGAATAASIKNPHSLAIDAAGNIYVSDYNGEVVRKVNSSGVISTFAGTGSSAIMEGPRGIVFDAAGNMYVSDSYGYRVRKVTPAGVITTIAGDGSGGAPTDGVQATASSLKNPSGLAIDSAGNLYIASPTTFRVRKVTPAGVISTFAGTGTTGSSGDGGQATSAQMKAPFGLAFDPSGNLYITDTSDHVVRKVTPAGVISTFAGTSGSSGFSGDGGAATSAKLDTPRGIAFDSAGNAYIADTNNNRIRKVDTSGNISTVVGDGTAAFLGDGGSASAAQLNAPYEVLIDPAGNLYITDYTNRRVRKVSLLATPAPTTTTSSSTTTVAPTTTTVPATTTTVKATTTTIASNSDGAGTESVGGGLPKTGDDSMAIALFALIVTCAGATLVSRRRLGA